jgi:hypothetical protein
MPQLPGNLGPAILSLAVAIGASFAVTGLADPARPEAVAHELAVQAKPDSARIIGLYTEALRRDSANPYRWADLGEALAGNEQLPQARTCFLRALQLSPVLPQIWLRDANFHFGLGENDRGLTSAAHVLRTVPDYDGILFSYFDRLIHDPGLVLIEIGDNRRAARAYTSHLIATGQIDAAQTAWRILLRRKLADQRITASYIDLLLRSARYGEAQRDWAGYAPGRGREASVLSNGGFENEPSGAAFDWRITPSEQFETGFDTTVVHEGHRSLCVKFYGRENVSYGNVIQNAVVEPGMYELRAWVRSSEVTTNECPQLQVYDPQAPSRLDVRSGPFCGTSDWHPSVQPFTVSSGTKMIAVRVLRMRSVKFDNKIGGSFWLDAVEVLKKRH